jgi:hypothetical protein
VKKHGYAILLFMLLGAFGVVQHARAQLPIAGSLVVAVASPTAGSTVGGIVAVNANVSVLGAVTVRSVQFRLDGANLGAEDTGAPYSIAWDTTSAGNGSHTLTAVAEDGLGMHYTSSPVTVSVSNVSPPPAPPTTPNARFEETDPSVTYGEGWTQGDASRAWSAGTAAVSAVPGARVDFTFHGPSVVWIGGRASGTGIARLYVDGVFTADVDTYSKTEEIRVPMFTLSGLSSANHLLTIEVTGNANPAAGSSLVVVDAFDVPGQSVSRLQETDPDVSYAGAWSRFDASRGWSAGIAAIASDAGAQATLPFRGTAVTWLGARGPQIGIARVVLDGNFVADVDGYAPAEQIQASVFTTQGLADGPHMLTISALGQKNDASSGTLVVVDGFEVAKTGTRYQESGPSIAYGSGWTIDNRDKAYSEGISAETNIPASRATFTFDGTGVSWIGARGPQCGTARVFLDGAPVADTDTYAPTEGPQHTDYSVQSLRRGTHTLTIEATGRNPASSDGWILIDAFDVIP